MPQNNNTLETKQFEILDFKFDDEQGVVQGYASVFNKIDSYGDTVIPQAFADNIKRCKNGKKRYPIILINHDSRSIPVGQVTDLLEDDKGLFMTFKFFDLTLERTKEVYAALKNGNKAMAFSIGYYAKEIEHTDEKEARRTGCYRKLKTIELEEVSIVNFPADQYAQMTSIKQEDTDVNIRLLEKFLMKKFSLSNREAKATIAEYKEFNPAETEIEQEKKEKTVEDMDISFLDSLLIGSIKAIKEESLSKQIELLLDAKLKV